MVKPAPSNSASQAAGFVLTVSCPDRVGIVAAVATFLAERGGDIEASDQFGDRSSGRFFLRIAFQMPGWTADAVRSEFAPLATKFQMDWALFDRALRPRLLILVSRGGHCLADLLYRYGAGLLGGEVAAVGSNHRDFYRLAASYDVPFHHLPVTPETRLIQERKVLELVESEAIDLVVLARYMQILSDPICRALTGRCINIHHSFLPSFRGAKPYHQAHAHGVKLIGATAHYVTADLDEGPIIEQDVVRVTHAMSPEALAAAGRDVECRVLARAVTAHIDHRVLLNGPRTIVFP